MLKITFFVLHFCRRKYRCIQPLLRLYAIGPENDELSVGTKIDDLEWRNGRYTALFR